MARILVIEDSRVQQVLIAQYLTKGKHTAEIAGDGPAGLELLRTAEFDVVITDIILPNMDGIELIHEIRTTCEKSVGIIAISGGGARSVQTHLETAKIAGANAALSKPFTQQELLQAVTKILQQSAPADSPPPKPS